MSSEEARIPLLGGEGRDSTASRFGRLSGPVRFALIFGVAAFAGVVYGSLQIPGETTELVTQGLSGDDGSGRPTLYALLDHEGMSQQLKTLQCYKKMANEAGMQLAVGPLKSKHFATTVALDDLVANDEHAWRAMTKGDWQRVEDVGGPDLCITAKRKGGRDHVRYSYPGGEVESDPDTVITSYKKVIKELKTREWWTCLGSLVFDECAEDEDAQIDFKPSGHVAEVMKIARKSLFMGKKKNPEEEKFRVVRMKQGAKGRGATEPFLELCREAKSGMGMPVYVSTENDSDKLHRHLHEEGCMTVRNITGYDMLQDWEREAMDQFFLAEAEEHYAMSCSSSDAVATVSRKLRAKPNTKTYVTSAKDFLDIPEAVTEEGCKKATKLLDDEADAGHAVEDQFSDKVKDAAKAVAAQLEKEEQEAEAAAAGGVVAAAAAEPAGEIPQAVPEQQQLQQPAAEAEAVAQQPEQQPAAAAAAAAEAAPQEPAAEAQPAAAADSIDAAIDAQAAALPQPEGVDAIDAAIDAQAEALPEAQPQQQLAEPQPAAAAAQPQLTPEQMAAAQQQQPVAMQQPVAPGVDDERMKLMEQDVSGLKVNMANIAQTLYNIQQSIAGKPIGPAPVPAAPKSTFDKLLGDDDDEEEEKEEEAAPAATPEDEKMAAVLADVAAAKEAANEPPAAAAADPAAAADAAKAADPAAAATALATATEKAGGEEAKGAPPPVASPPPPKPIMYPPPLPPLVIEDMASYEEEMMHANEDH